MKGGILKKYCKNNTLIFCSIKKNTTFAPQSREIAYLKVMKCPGGGIGRRARFRCVCREACRFESCSGHFRKADNCKVARFFYIRTFLYI